MSNIRWICRSFLTFFQSVADVGLSDELEAVSPGQAEVLSQGGKL